jgi:glutamyl-tRNA(Gln) amidotransferase subunit E
VLTESLRGLAREQIQVENVKDSHLKEVFELVAAGRTAKESVLEILKWLSSNPDASAEDALGALKLRMLTNDELDRIISKALESNRSLVEENGTKAMGKMMNLVMGEVRGRADPKLVTELLRTRLEQFKG